MTDDRRGLYVDTSALLKTLRREPETGDLLRYLAESARTLVTSEVTITELHRAARWYGLPADEAERRLGQLDLVPVPRAQLRTAGLLPDPSDPPGTRLRSLDAIHLAAAAQVESDTLLSYDRDQSRAARAAGLQLVHPGRGADWYA